MKKLTLVIIAIICIFFTGCAGIINGRHDTITVHSIDDGVSIYVDGVKLGYNEVITKVKKGDTHIIKVTKKGCKTRMIQTGRDFDFTTLLGILIDWGIISIPIDLISGAAWKTSPTIYTLNPICEPCTE